MSEDNKSLAALRQKIDGIDDALHNLLMERASIATEIGRTKPDGPVWRPAREAQLVRRLLGRHDGPFPRATVVQIWREIVSAMVRLQGSLAVAVYAPENNRRCRDMARDHFGAETPLALYSSARAVLTAVQDGSATVGVLPAPEDSEETPWWPILAGMPPGRPTICTTLPFAPSPPGNGDTALCVSSVPPEDSGHDRSIVVLRTDPQVSRDRLNAAIAAAGISPRRLIGRLPSRDDTSFFFAELDGFAGPDDARLARLSDPDTGIAEAMIHLGCYPAPIDAAELVDVGAE